jgi:hypothetical protein
VRTYDIVRDHRGWGDGILASRVLFPEAGLAQFNLDDILASWRGQRAQTYLKPEDFARLDAALAASGFDEPAPRGLVLPSDGSYWVVSTCRDGVFHFNAFAYPSPRFAAIHFATELARLDRTGVAFDPPRPSDHTRIELSQGDRDSRRFAASQVFDLEVGDNGLIGVGALF